MNILKISYTSKRLLALITQRRDKRKILDRKDERNKFDSHRIISRIFQFKWKNRKLYNT